MSLENLEKEFESWNPMETDYKKKEFNQYNTGPGAKLDKDLQPCQQYSSNRNVNRAIDKNKPVPCLIFKNVPPKMTKTAMFNLCQRHGNVTAVRDSQKCSYFFADFATVSDMEAAFRALTNTNYGFTVAVGRSTYKPQQSGDQQGGKVLPVSPRTTGIDYQNRTMPESKQRPRPNIDQMPLIKEEFVKGVCSSFLNGDAHTLEREGYVKPQQKGNFLYRTGRAHVLMPESTKEMLKKKHSESTGNYSASKDMYMNKSIEISIPNMGNCVSCKRECSNICSRCSAYYCNVECQKRNWQEHRYQCGTPKKENINPKKEKTSSNKSDKLEAKKSSKNKSDKSDAPISSNNKSGADAPMSSKTESDKSDAPTSSQNMREKSDAQTSFKKVSDKSDAPLSSKNKSDKSDAQVSSKNENGKSNAIIRKPPADKEVVTSANKYDWSSLLPRSGNIVTITAVLKTNVVFIRSKTYEANISFIKTVDGLQSLKRELNPLTIRPKCGQIVIAENNEQFNRALVMNDNNPEKICVNFMDYGDWGYLKLQDLYEVPIEYIELPRHAIAVMLKGVPDCYMTDEIRNFMYSYLNGINVYIKYKAEDYYGEKNVCKVELIDETTQQNLNKVICKLAEPIDPISTNDICYKGYLEHKLLPTGNDIALLVMDNSLMSTGCISCTTVPMAKEIQKFQNEFQKYISNASTEAYAPRVDELCIAKYAEDGLWYRGRCLELVGDGHPTILFFDYGNICIVPIANIRRYPLQFTYPIYTADFEIKGLPETCSGALVEKLEELIPHSSIIKFEEVALLTPKDYFYTVSLPNVIEKLKEMNLL